MFELDNILDDSHAVCLVQENKIRDSMSHLKAKESAHKLNCFYPDFVSLAMLECRCDGIRCKETVLITLDLSASNCV